MPEEFQRLNLIFFPCFSHGIKLFPPSPSSPYFLYFLSHSWKFFLFSTLHKYYVWKIAKHFSDRKAQQKQQQQNWENLKEKLELDELILTSIIGFVTQERWEWKTKNKNKKKKGKEHTLHICMLCMLYMLYGLGNILRFQIYWY